MMTTTRAASLVALLCWTVGAAAQIPSTLDTSTIGPPVGARVPPIAGIDQFGRPQTLDAISGPKGAMLVFFRSADW
jgi:hypothetical protein